MDSSEEFVRTVKSQVKLITEKTQYKLSNSSHTPTSIYNFLTENNIIFNCYYIYTRYVMNSNGAVMPLESSWFGVVKNQFAVFYSKDDNISNYMNVSSLLKKSTYIPLLSVTSASKMTDSNTVVGVTTLETKMF